jgi:hypothetical protein
MGSLWSFLAERKNQKTLSWLGGGAIVVIGGLWAAFFVPSENDATVKAGDCGIADSGTATDVTVGCEAPPVASTARLVFRSIEPEWFINQTPGLMTFGVWFKNEGQVAAQSPTVGIMPVLIDKIISRDEEETYFNMARTHRLFKSDGGVLPGHDVFFVGPSGLNEAGWVDFQGKKKYLYVFSSVTYSSGGSNQRISVTETCVLFGNGDINIWNGCLSGHNKVLVTP